jgi:hypothetical protein
LSVTNTGRDFPFKGGVNFPAKPFETRKLARITRDRLVANP